MTVEIARREDGAAGRYVASVEGVPAGELTYRRDAGADGDRVAVMHTEAYRDFRGHGVAYALVARLAEDAAREGFSIVPHCWYARDKLNENAEWRHLVEGER